MQEKIYETLRGIIREQAPILITRQENEAFGHYSTNVAFLLSKQKKKNPVAIAEEIVEVLNEPRYKNIFERVQIAHPGFINFWISESVLQEEVKLILRKKDAYGKKILPQSEKKSIQIEFISANPTGPLTMANGRGGFLGDTLARVIERVGHSVKREYYVNDAGGQVRVLGESVLAELGKVAKREEQYKGEYIKHLAKIFKTRASQVEKTEGRIVAEYILKNYIKPSVKRMGIVFSKWFSEYDNLHKKGELKKALSLLEERGVITRREGATWLQSSGIADEKERVLIKSDGDSTYFLADIAYHYDKFIKRKFDVVIDIWGADHHGYIARLKSGVEALGVNPLRLKILIMQLVRLVKNGKEVRMSKRKGEFITLDDLLKEVGLDAARFFFLMHSSGSHMDFDLGLAKEASLRNPVYYVQYAYVRAINILGKVKIKLRGTKPDMEKLHTPEDVALMLRLAEFPDLLLYVAEHLEAHHLTRYAMDLARTFHNFYEKERVAGEEKEVLVARAALVSATTIVFKNLFSILGVSAPKKM